MTTIRSDEDFHRIIEQVAEGNWAHELHFEGYPRFEVTLRGERFHGGVPTRIMPMLLELQRIVDKTAAQILDVKRLDNQTKRRTEIVVRVENGSTTFASDLAPVFNTLASNTSGSQALAAILAAILVVGGLGALHLWLRHRRDMAGYKVHEESISLLSKLSDRDTKCLKIIEGMIERIPAAERVAASSEKFVKALVNKMEADDELIVQGEPTLNGATGKRLMRKPRAVPIEDRIDNDFLILSVVSGSIRNGVRAKIRAINESQELVISIPEGTLSDTQLREVQSGEWDKRPLRMEINVTRVEDRITKATLVKAGFTRLSS